MKKINLISVKLKRRFLNEIDKRKFFSAKRIIEGMSNMPDFPSSACTSDQYVDLTLSGASKTYSLILETANIEPITVCSIDDYCQNSQEVLTTKIESLFNKYGSDKASHHNYHRIYSKIFQQKIGNRIRILEIGLGTNNTDVPSNMGAAGRPGASLRAWAELDNKFEVFGADVDNRVLFQEERITTYLLDQIDTRSWVEFKEALTGLEFDVIIDDGLHSPEANLNSIIHLMPKLRSGGVLVIEDIALRALPVWSLFKQVAPKNWDIKMISARKSFVLVIKVD